MYFTCVCGCPLSNTASPNDVEHLLIGDRARELLEHLVDQEIRATGDVDMWPEHWGRCGVIFWKCHMCTRLYQFNERYECVTMYEPVPYDPS